MADKNDLLSVIRAEQDLHPSMDERDLQKLVYQSVYGGDHLLDDPERYAEALRAEWSRLPEGRSAGDESALQSIDPEGKTLRIHLAACKRLAIDVDRLIDLLVHQKKKRGRRAEYERRWSEAIALARAGAIPFSADALARVGHPETAPHHGPAYGRAAYRIVNDATDPTMNDGLLRLGVRR